MKKTLCIVSHTHWDREWYLPFEEYRLKLVDLIDRLLKIIEKYPDYIFHLDAQTVVLEDYLEIRPSKKDILKKHITNGNIIVGPWYLQNDFYLTSGESTIRNLIIGKGIAEEFGRCAMVGYAPDQFGNISQLPQILSDFGIDSFVFARGFCEYYKVEDGSIRRRNSPLEFIWEGADDSRLNAFYMRGWYNNAQRIPLDTEKARKMADSVHEDFCDKTATEYYLMMNGVDHLEAQDDLPEAIAAFNKEHGRVFTMKQYSLEDYIADVKKSIADNNISLTLHKGELRKGSTGDILPGTLSSRHYIKVANVRLQNMLEQRLEPLYSMLTLYGMEDIYSIDHFRYAWKRLIQNHPHDTICGCSRDAVHKQSLDRLERLKEFCDDMFSRGLYELAYHSEAVKSDAEYIITAVNTTAIPQNGIVTLTADLPSEKSIKGFYITDTNDNRADFGIISKERVRRDVTSPLNLPGSILVDRYTIHLDAGEIKPYSQKSFKLIPCDEKIYLLENSNKKLLENKYIKVSVADTGKIDILFKETGELIEDALYIEDSGDRGSSYNYISTGEKPITSKDFIPTVEVLENNRFCARIRLVLDMVLPKCYDFANLKRSSDTDTVTVALTLELSASDRMLKIGYEINNRCRDHRLRLVTADKRKNADFYADIPFDIIKREDVYFEPEPPSQTFPNTSFVAIEKDGKGMAVFTEGAHEAERINGEESALTLLRATGVIERGADMGPIGGEMWVADGNQCIGMTSGRLALFGYAGNTVSAQLPCISTIFRTPVCALCIPRDRRVFTGGRPAVQGTPYSDIYYLPDIWQDVSIKENTPALTVTGAGITLSAMKLSEDEKGIVLRFYNYSDRSTAAYINASGNIYLSDMAEQKRKSLGKDHAELSVAPKKIVTLYIELQNRTR